MKKKPKIDFATIHHLAWAYQEQYLERGLCLSAEQDDACFRDFVWQYYSALYWGKPINPTITTDILSF